MPDLYCGTSAGALNACYAALHPGADGVDRLDALWRSIHTWQVFPLMPLHAVLGLLGLSDSLTSNDSLRSLLHRHIGRARLESLPVPTSLVATDVLSGRSTVLREGSAADAALASSAIPGVFPPVKFEGRFLMDGGVSDDTPVDVALRQGATRLFVLPTGFGCSLQTPPRGALGMALHALDVLIEQRLIEVMHRVPAHVEMVVLPPPCPLDIVPIDFSHTGWLIEQGYQLARRRLVRGVPAGGHAAAFQRRHARGHRRERGE